MKFIETIRLLDILFISLVVALMKENEENSFPSRSRRQVAVKPSNLGIWPWIVSVRITYPAYIFMGISFGDKDRYCSGTLIQKQWVLTAAECIHFQDLGWEAMPEDVIVKVGELSLETSLMDKVIGTIGYLYNLVLLKLETPANLDVPMNTGEYEYWYFNPKDNATYSSKVTNRIISRIGEAELLGTDEGRLKDNSSCFEIVWGCKTLTNKTLRHAALEVTMLKLGDELCTKYYKHKMGRILCAGRVGKRPNETCYSEKGSPLVCKIGKRMVQVGVATYITPYFSRTSPYRRFTRISAFRRWIDYAIETDTN